MSENQIGPISPQERIGVLDALRGFAVLGILIGNMQWFSGYRMMPPAVAADGSATDHIIQFLIHFFYRRQILFDFFVSIRFRLCPTNC